MTYLVLLLVYSALLVALGLWIGRRVRTAQHFFVAGRALGPGLLLSTLLAANIGAGSTVGAARLGYDNGLSAWWWVGSAGIGSLVLAFWVGPKIRTLAEERDFRTVGDFLDWRYGRSVRFIVSVLLMAGTLFILAGQLVALSLVLNVVAGIDPIVGTIIGGLVMTTYFTAGGLLTSAAVNVVQLAVLLLGFAVALPLGLAHVGGLSGLHASLPGPAYWDFTGSSRSGWGYLAMLAPAFIVSPGLLQKIYGARDGSAVRWGTALNAVVLLLFAFAPPLLGMVSRVLHPDLPNHELALPTLLRADLPTHVGALGLAALFSAEVSTADAILFMLATATSQDLYRRFLAPGATEEQVLRVARLSAAGGGVLGVVLAIAFGSIIRTLEIFYTVLVVTLFVPLLMGLYVRRAGVREAIAAIVAGEAAMIAVHAATSGAGYGMFTPALCGILASIGAAAVTLALPARGR
ncbi:MAG TPA: sodium:solute symporter family protein [Vicinamibacterales bacterium]|nr:sodium:solute symporter family protein [Vicinamibacterales bacterium]